ncbi:MAG: PIN domain-containing protein [Acidobacteriota bacterium]|nr:PIN domain-containing protein [Acidobacteriota bacterium]
MSCSLDVNLLLYASDRSSPHFEVAQEFLRRKLRDREILYVAWPTAMAYLRMATHSRIFKAPLTPAEALSNLQSLLAQPQVKTLSERAGFLGAYAEATRAFPVRANLVPDAHLATILRQHGVATIYTNDVDFKKFDFLRVINPLAPSS